MSDEHAGWNMATWLATHVKRQTNMHVRRPSLLFIDGEVSMMSHLEKKRIKLACLIIKRIITSKIWNKYNSSNRFRSNHESNRIFSRIESLSDRIVVGSNRHRIESRTDRIHESNRINVESNQCRIEYRSNRIAVGSNQCRIESLSDRIQVESNRCRIG